MANRTVIVTGIARHSLGEAFVRGYRSRVGNAQIIGMDLAANSDLPDDVNLCQIALDLNPLHHVGGLNAFAYTLAGQLRGAIRCSTGVECLVQCAGAYDFGSLLEHDIGRRERLLGLNVLGATEVLHAVMSLNAEMGQSNETRFTSILVGSFQALYARAKRPVYAPSKAYGIDLCTSLAEGHEIARCVYLAPGPIDTPMLHRNHWVVKAGGSLDFFEHIFGGARDEYGAIFVDCDTATVARIASYRFPSKADELLETLMRYREIRSKAFAKATGVMTPEACAGAMIDVITSESDITGLWEITAGDEGNTTARRTAFGHLKRQQIT